jgi:hypothetical protein
VSSALVSAVRDATAEWAATDWDPRQVAARLNVDPGELVDVAATLSRPGCPVSSRDPCWVCLFTIAFLVGRAFGRREVTA